MTKPVEMFTGKEADLTPSQRDLSEQSTHYRDHILELLTGVSGRYALNALVNATAYVAASGITQGKFPKEVVMEHMSAAIDHEVRERAS